MAKISLEGFEQYEALLKKLEASTLSVIKPAVYDGAAVVADEVKRKLRSVVSSKATGDLERSLGLTRMRDDNGFIYTKLGFDGYDRKGSANPPKAHVLERGRSDQPRRRKKPFIAPAVMAARSRAEEAMRNTVDQQIQSIMKDKTKEG